eukprot:CAMPEP_0203855934 /NCGR_PEP_ID=MMETSP0359-20131031/9900_1 /ASSEMBLY_ACC=CAM_ASM_000338 /TAXON_ID=268821 /ORGANISM="Scrippsiella Hangoei, Strain SHTV-5" /LENGTH=94 /DNA_ID=CAMNT_0050772503 /DNA_START=248 /DNA_END=529 /DNA_ORIENTATION=+
MPPSLSSASSIFTRSSSAVTSWNRTGPDTTTLPQGSFARYLTRPPTVSSEIVLPSRRPAGLPDGTAGGPDPFLSCGACDGRALGERERGEGDRR